MSVKQEFKTVIMFGDTFDKHRMAIKRSAGALALMAHSTDHLVFVDVIPEESNVDPLPLITIDSNLPKERRDKLVALLKERFTGATVVH